jgi:hypothetical protein
MYTSVYREKLSRILRLGSWNDVYSQLLVNHQRQDSHLCGTSVVQFGSALDKLGLLIKGIPARA